MTSRCYGCFQCLGEFRSLVQHSQFSKTPHQVYQAISKLILGQLLFENISLSLYPALHLLSVLARAHLQGHLVLDFSERFLGHKKLELAR